MSKLRHTLFVIGLLALAACTRTTPPKDIDQRLTRTTEHGKYVVSMRPVAEPLAINQMHTWEILVSTPQGVPVTHAQIAFDGEMPEHGHGLPTSPRVTGEIGGGRYRLDGVKFSMEGWWKLTVAVRAEAGGDSVAFNVVLPDHPESQPRHAAR